MTDMQQDENKLIAVRREKLAAIRRNGNAFPNAFRRNVLAAELQDRLGDRSKEELEALNQRARVAGRVMAQRGPFVVIQDMSGRIQFYIDKKNLPAELLEEIKGWDLGDIVGGEGPVHKSGKGDLYVYLDSATLLTKALRPLPEKWHGLADQEQRYRQRYVDLIVNQTARDTFVLRSRIIEYIRRYFVDAGFLEVETPMMQVIPGGASAKPFVTHHNALDMPLFLRIAPELYLKRLVVGGFEKVFEINRNFRNEGLSTRHNPEFTMIEFYEAYADYRDMMDRTEALLRGIAVDLLGTTSVPYQGETYDFGKPFARMSVKEAILHFNADIVAGDLDDLERATAIARRLGCDVKPTYGLGKVQIEIFEATAEHQLKDPTFITAYPTEVSPLARRNDDDPFVTDRFEFFIGGREIANGFSELNDPEDQAERFRRQVEEKEAGDEEAMHFDADYIRALEHGLPPTAGEGIGIDRLVMLFTDSPSIRDVLLFPHMRLEA
ncbi:MAG: lysine--tRNA ligase [Gammaproteobacteria bacterium]|nr:lysine--tRNA ligase [Gammaproteobacteria bacterium]MCP5298965.1 lysine--tRNA ligase [Chromatiaceae bacterium]